MQNHVLLLALLAAVCSRPLEPSSELSAPSPSAGKFFSMDQVSVAVEAASVESSDWWSLAEPLPTSRSNQEASGRKNHFRRVKEKEKGVDRENNTIRVMVYSSDEDAHSVDNENVLKYKVKQEEVELDPGHEEQRKGVKSNGRYRVVLPDGKVVTFKSDARGYVPTIAYD